MAKLKSKGRSVRAGSSRTKTRAGSKRASGKKSSTKQSTAKKKRGKILVRGKKARMSSKALSMQKTVKKSKKTSIKSSKKTSPGLLRDAKRIAELRAMLEARRAEILEEIKQARASGTESNQATYAEVGDLVTASVEKERAFEYSEAGINALKEIELALEKLDQGTYGICELCGKPISVARLKIMPSATLCLECKAKQEQMGSVASRADRHIEIYPIEDEGEIDQ